MIYNKVIDGVKFTLVCESWNTRNSWGHKVILYKNDSVIVGTTRIRYYNRTWESYQYQSAIKNVIYKVIQEIKVAAKKVFLSINNYKVMTKKRLSAFLDFLKQDNTYNIYNELYRMF